MKTVIVDGLLISTKYLQCDNGVWRRRCRRCEELKFPTREDFHQKGWHSELAVLDRTCKVCRAAERERADAKKCCNKCGEVKPATEEFFSTIRGYLIGTCRVCRAPGMRAACRRYGKTEAWKLSHTLSRIKTFCRRSEIPLNSLEVEELLRTFKTGQPCPCCGKPMCKGTHTASVDRFVPTFGYVGSNIDLLCYRCNRLKSDATLEDFKNLTIYMKKQLRKRGQPT